MFQDARLFGTKPCPTPLQLQLQLQKSFRQPLSEPIAYRRSIWILIYLTHSRLEISYVVSKPSRFLDASADEHIIGGHMS